MGTLIELVVSIRYNLCRGPDMTSLGGIPLTSSLHCKRSAVTAAFCLLLSPQAGPFSLLSPHCVRTSLLSQVEPSRRHHSWSQGTSVLITGRLPRARLNTSQAPISCSESQGPRRKGGWYSLWFPGKIRRGMDFMVETWMLDGHLWVEVAGV